MIPVPFIILGSGLLCFICFAIFSVSMNNVDLFVVGGLIFAVCVGFCLASIPFFDDSDEVVLDSSEQELFCIEQCELNNISDWSYSRFNNLCTCTKEVNINKNEIMLVILE